jgi:hypothetical protein
MKPGSIKPVYLLAAFLLIGLSTLALVSWDRKQGGDDHQRYYQDFQDTPKKKNNVVREKKVRDLDDAMEEMDNVNMDEIMANVQKEIAEAMKSVDAAKIQKEVADAMKEVNMEKIMQEVQQAMKSIDFDAMQKEIKEAMKDIDAAKIQKEVNEAMKEVDMEKIKKEISEAMSKVDMAKIKAEIESAQKINTEEMQEQMKKVQEELKGIGPKIEKEMAEAKVSIEKAKAELKEYKGFVDGLEKDGLINKKEDYTIKHKDGELMINGKKASEQIYNKYRSFLEKHKSFNIEKDKDDFDFDMD